MSQPQTIATGNTLVLPFCCTEIADGGASRNEDQTGVVVPQDGNYAIKFGCDIIWTAAPTDFTTGGVFQVQFRSATGSLYGEIGTGNLVVGQGYFEINTHIAPLAGSDQVTVEVFNNSGTDWTVDNYFLEVAYSGVRSDTLTCPTV